VCQAVEGNLYNLEAHLDRIEESARGVALRIPVTRERLLEILIRTVRAGGRRDCVLRVFVSRGPGGFSANPYECSKSQLYAVVTAVPPLFMSLHPEGARLLSSSVSAKPAGLAVVKTCNYVPNVLMKKEALDHGADFAVGYDERGFLTEGAVENVGIVTVKRRLLFPKPDRILRGTTMVRAMALAQDLVNGGELTAVGTADITRPDMWNAAEILMTGTTLHVAAAIELDGRRIGDGRPGSVYRKLSALLERDMRENRTLLTPVFE
jgi:branched-chain amino acid aminotransferase